MKEVSADRAYQIALHVEASKKDRLITLLYDLNTKIEWEDMEEQQEALFALIRYYGFRFIDLNSIRKEVIQDIWDANPHMYGSIAAHKQRVYDQIDEHAELNELNRYETSGEAWCEEINKITCDSLDAFTAICYRFIDFHCVKK